MHDSGAQEALVRGRGNDGLHAMLKGSNLKTQYSVGCKEIQQHMLKGILMYNNVRLQLLLTFQYNGPQMMGKGWPIYNSHNERDLLASHPAESSASWNNLLNSDENPYPHLIKWYNNIDVRIFFKKPTTTTYEVSIKHV